MTNPNDPLDLDFGDLDDLDLSDDDQDFIDKTDTFDQIDIHDHDARPKRRDLDEVDIGGFEILDLQLSTDVSGEFTERFLLHVRTGYEKTGRGDYTCVLRWYHNRVNDADVDRFVRTVRARVSRLRQKIGRADRDFVVTLVHYEIMNDSKHVIITMARMARTAYLQYEAGRQSERNAAKPTRAGRLLNLL